MPFKPAHMCLSFNSMFLFDSFSCTGVKEHDAGDIIKYHCPNCQIGHGPSKCTVVS